MDTTRGAAWEPIVDLLEEFEYRLVRPHGWSRGLLMPGIAALVVGAGGVVWRWRFGGPEPFASALGMAGLVLMIVGIAITVASAPRKVLEGLNAWIERNAWGIATVAMLALASFAAMLAVGAAVVAGMVGTSGEIADAVRATWGVLVITALNAFAVYWMRGSQIRIGIVAMRWRIRAGVAALWAESISLAAVLSVAVVLTSASGADPWAFAIAAVAVVVGAHYQRSRGYDADVEGLLLVFDGVRAAGLTAAQSGDNRPLTSEVRRLQHLLAPRPRMVRPFIASPGFAALCLTTDARATNRVGGGLAFEGDGRQHAVISVASLPDRAFALGMSQVFDALLQQIDRHAFGLPQEPRAKKGADLRGVLESGASIRPLPLHP